MTKQAVDFLYDLVKTPSLSTHEYLVAGVLRKQMKKLGLEAHIDSAGNVVSVPEEKTECDLLIFSHMDVVYPILEHKKTDKEIHGRGAVDAKGPLCALLHGYAEVKDKLAYKVVFAAVTEEEATSSKGIRHLLTYVKPRMALLGEPSNLNGITIAYKGRVVAKVTVKGKHSHAANPKDNPIDSLLEYYQKCKSKFEFKTPYNSVTITPTYIKFGNKEALNVIPEAGTLILDIRFPPSVSLDEIKKVVSSDKNVNVEFEEALPAAETDVNNPIARALIKSIRDAKLKPRFVKKTGSCDMNVIAPMGIPTVAYGPGDPNLDHMDDEHLKIDKYLKSIEIIKQALLTLKIKP